LARAASQICPLPEGCACRLRTDLIISKAATEVGEEEICPIALAAGSSGASAITVVAASPRCSRGEVASSCRSHFG
jgi:hypothetical protein